MFVRWGPTIQPLTPEERAQLWIDKHLPKSAIEKMDPGARVYGEMSRELHYREKLAEEKKKTNHWLDELDGSDDE